MLSSPTEDTILLWLFSRGMNDVGYLIVNLELDKLISSQRIFRLSEKWVSLIDFMTLWHVRN